MAQLNENDKKFKVYLKEKYTNQMNLQKAKEMEEKRKALEEEKAKLCIMQQQMEDERRQKQEQKLFLKKQMEANLKRKQSMQEREKNNETHEKVEYNHSVLENSLKEIERENKYRQFFVDYDKKLQRRAKVHVDSVVSPESEKNKQLQKWINKNEEIFKEKLLEKEKQLNEWRKNVKSKIFIIYKEPHDNLWRS